MVTEIASMTAEQQLLLKLQSTVTILAFGAVTGLLLRQVCRRVFGPEFMTASPSRRSPLEP
ncbi:hypothetical protein [Halohasta salina]|uniref:hypothetical protein n=1 Tax=Halohasta salina TaxID=2961621 RepID=UPI0020A329BC|nr:hypothetical protein [Halohasta salina]